MARRGRRIGTAVAISQRREWCAARKIGRSGAWTFSFGPRRAPRPRLRVVPEARKILAGGEAQRTHRTRRPNPTLRPGGAREPGKRADTARLCDGSSGARLPGWRAHGVASRPGGFTGGFATLHHRLISCVPPARRGRGVARPDSGRDAPRTRRRDACGTLAPPCLGARISAPSAGVASASSPRWLLFAPPVQAAV